MLKLTERDLVKMVSNIQNMENLNPQVMRILGKEMQSLKMEKMVKSLMSRTVKKIQNMK